ncbi:PLP-dependent aminotransferase family protein [Microbacterium hydrocarbonoxydans]|uniref:aminotransferase-like domain-containing protein n=1 Tax=Microbacterium hydrocarbonoxydans TaxID=273678 RepID=UPI0007BBC80E|nr:PLP-dependent aminotransferase family protein [Microbacterium hydrocarbonoxydans]GAT72901.1 aminotransferase [Microbacterium sp. HM58-2]
MSPSTSIVALPGRSARAGSAKTSPVRELLALTERPEVISFAGGLPAPELFDLDGIRAAYDEVLRTPAVLQYSTSEGNHALREEVARQYTADGLPTAASDLIVTTGSQQGLGLLSTALLDPGDAILVEEPCYLAALQTFALAGARVIGVPYTGDELDLDALERLAAEHGPRFFYTVPTFQNPTGRTHDLAARERIADAAQRHGFRIVEDEPYRQLRYSGAPLPSLATLAPDHVLSLGSFSKVIAPGLRIGWVRTTADIRPTVTIAKQAADLHTSTIDQAAAAQYLTSGRASHALDRIRGAYAARRDAMLDALPQALPAGSEWNRPDGGMFVWARLPEGMDATAALATALSHDVAFVPGSPFFAGPADVRALRLSFTTYSPERIRIGLSRLGAAFSSAG